MASLSRILLRIERAVRAVRIASELAEAPAPSVAVRHRADAALAAAVQRDASAAVGAASAAVAAGMEVAPAACAARAVWMHQDSGSWRPLVYCGLALGVPAAAPFVAHRAGLPAASESLAGGVVDGASAGSFVSLGLMPVRAAVVVSAAGMLTRIRRGATPSDALAGLLGGWVWARSVAAVVHPMHDDSPAVEPVEISEYRARRA